MEGLICIYCISLFQIEFYSSKNHMIKLHRGERNFLRKQFDLGNSDFSEPKITEELCQCKWKQLLMKELLVLAYIFLWVSERTNHQVMSVIADNLVVLACSLPSGCSSWMCREARSWSLFLKGSHCSLFQGKFTVSSPVEPVQLH